MRRGEQIGECGNSGNTSEPHVHFQLKDRPSIMGAAGLPFRFAGLVTDDGESVDLPRNGHAVATGSSES